jgi:hypothetical protein
LVRGQDHWHRHRMDRFKDRVRRGRHVDRGLASTWCRALAPPTPTERRLAIKVKAAGFDALRLAGFEN